MLLRIREEIKEDLNETPNPDEFLPFVNERNSVGKIIKPSKRKKLISPEEILQSLKMTTKEFFSRKKFQKDLRKFNLLKNSLKSKEIDVDREISECERMLTNFQFSKPEASDSDLFYDKDRKTQSRIHLLRCNTPSYKRKIGSQMSKRQKPVSGKPRSLRKTNITVFRQVDRQSTTPTHSQFMANWTNCSIPYRQHIQSRSRSPQKSNYIPQQHNIFLRRSQTHKKLKYSLYDPFV